MELLARALDYPTLTKLDITKLNQPANTYVVVSTQGDGDEKALEQAMAFKPAYLGFVASSKKAKVVKDILSERGTSTEELELIKAPAGLDIKARSPHEIALSILAEIVMLARNREPSATKESIKKEINMPAHTNSVFRQLAAASLSAPPLGGMLPSLAKAP